MQFLESELLLFHGGDVVFAEEHGGVFYHHFGYFELYFFVVSESWFEEGDYFFVDYFEFIELKINNENWF